MDDKSTPPPIPSRHLARQHQHTRRRSLQDHSGPSLNRVSIQPASPEVLSSLISSLSVISSGANQLFEISQSDQAFSNATKTTFNGSFGNAHTQNGNKSSGGSFGIDYGAYEQPSLRYLVEEELLDELAASPPVIRTSKPPSGFSPLTAPKSPRESNIKSFLRGSSRPSSKGSSGSKDQDDSSSIGNLSIEPGVAPTHNLQRKSSGDSWGKKQGRNQKGLMYMSSKERLREREQDRKRTGAGAVGGNTAGAGLDRIPLPRFDSDSFMAETAIGEEPESTSLAKNPSDVAGPNQESPVLGVGSPGGIGSGRFIPARDSSLRKPTTSTKKRVSQRQSRQNGKQWASEDGAEDSVNEADGQKSDRKRDRNRRDRKALSPDTTSRMMEPLHSLEMPTSGRSTTLPSKQVVESVKVSQSITVEDADEGAPSPAVAQRKARPSPDRGDRSSGQKRRSGQGKPEPISAAPQPKRNSSRLKRLSAPLSPRTSEKDSHNRSSSQPLSIAGSSEAVKPSQIHVDDRPTSADSIDDAVEAYLCSPRLSQKIRHPQTGRTISFSEVGDSEGFAVFCCVGMGLTRYITAFYDELALTLKLRLITPDRPGVGDSEPYKDGTATPLSWPGAYFEALLYRTC